VIYRCRCTCRSFPHDPSVPRATRQYSSATTFRSLSWLLLRGNVDLSQIRSRGDTLSSNYCARPLRGVAGEASIWEVPALLIFVASLLALSSIDLEKLILPKRDRLYDSGSADRRARAGRRITVNGTGLLAPGSAPPVVHRVLRPQFREPAVLGIW